MREINWKGFVKDAVEASFPRYSPSIRLYLLRKATKKSLVAADVPAEL